MNSNRPRNRRWRLMANLRIQGGLLIRLALYWLVFQVAQLGTIALFSFLAGGSSPDGNMRFIVPSVIVSLLFLPVMMLDLLRFSNRFVGPFVNLRNKLMKLSHGNMTEEIDFRRGDYMVELVDAYNRIRDRMLELEKQVEQHQASDSFHQNDVEAQHV